MSCFFAGRRPGHLGLRRGRDRRGLGRLPRKPPGQDQQARQRQHAGRSEVTLPLRPTFNDSFSFAFSAQRV